jgi:hypothetical protein
VFSRAPDSAAHRLSSECASRPKEATVVRRYVVRSQAEAVQVARALAAVSPDGEIPQVQFDGWPKVKITVPEGIDTAAHRMVQKLQALLRRQFSLLKYGRRRKLTAGERASTKLGVVHLSPTQLVLDFSRAATACVSAIHTRIAREGARALYQQQSLFGQVDAETWPGAASRVGLAMVNKMTARQVAGVAIAAVIAAGLSYSATTMWAASLKHSVEAQTMTERLPLPDNTTVTAENGQTIAPPAQRVAETALERESRDVASVLAESYAGPFSGYMQMADLARPVILDLAHVSVLQVNDLTIPARIAKAAAKVMKQDPTYGWKTVVQAADRDKGWKTVTRRERA